MTLSDKIEAYKGGDTSLRTELLLRTHKALAYIINKINETPGGWGVVKDLNDPNVSSAKSLIIAVMGEVNFKYFTMTASIMRTIK